MSQWFRFYESALDDPKVQCLSGDLFKGWVNLLCLAKRHDGALPPHKDIAFALRKTGAETTKLLDSLVSCGLLDHDETGISPHNWSGRQYVSDTSLDRVRRHRKKRADAGLIAQWTAPAALRASVYERDGHACVYCGETQDLSLDHKTPERRGGSNDFENLQTACRQCNGAKRDLTHEEFVARNDLVTLPKRPQSTEQNRTDIPLTEVNGRTPPQEDPVKALFDDGVKILGDAGTPERQARSQIGKWRKNHGDDATRTAIQTAADMGISEPVAWIEASLNRPKETYDQRRIREGLEVIMAYEAKNDRH